MIYNIIIIILIITISILIAKKDKNDNKKYKIAIGILFIIGFSVRLISIGEFPNGLNSFGRGIIEKPENMAELKRLISIECKKDMRIKLIDDKNENQKKEENKLDLGIDINYFLLHLINKNKM